MSNKGYSPDRHVDLHAMLKKSLQRGRGGGSWAHQDPLPLNYVLAIQLRPDTCGFTRMENEDFGMVDLSSSEF